MADMNDALAALNQGIPTGEDLDHLILPPKAAETLREYLQGNIGPDGAREVVIAAGNKLDVRVHVTSGMVTMEFIAYQPGSTTAKMLRVPLGADQARLLGEVLQKVSVDAKNIKPEGLH